MSGPALMLVSVTLAPVDCPVHAIVVPGGAAPSYAQDYYDRDNEAYRAWDAISRDREAFRRWLRDLREVAA